MNDEHVSLDKKNLQDNRLSFMKIITKKIILFHSLLFDLSSS